VTGFASGYGFGAILSQNAQLSFLLAHGDGDSPSPLTTIPHIGPLEVCTVVPGAYVAGCAMADPVAGPVGAIAITPTVSAATVKTEPNGRERPRNIY
jgi:hypothetical protein